MKAVCVLLAFVVLCGLGGWQLQRLQWKEGLLAHIETQMAEPPLNLNTDLTGDRYPDLDYRHVAISGQFLPSPQFLMPSRVRNGQVGYHVVSIFASQNHGFWLVNRGWIPPELAKAPPAAPAGVQTVQGIARKAALPGAFTPPNDPDRNLWFSYAPSQMMATAQLQAMPAGWVIEQDAAPAANSAPPYGGVTQLAIPNNHWQYALTWFSLAVVLLVVAAVRARQ